MKFKKQNQHGVWAMIILPVILGMMAGGFNFSQVLFLAAWLLLFLSVDQVLFFIKRWKRKEYEYLKSALFLGLLSFVLLIYPLITDYRIIYFFMAMIPLGIVNMYFAKQKDERNILNDVAAILIFAIAGGASAYLGTHTFNINVVTVIIISFVHFVGTAFAVKTVIREKRNPAYHYLSYGYHAVVVVVMFLWHWILGVMFIPSFVRALYVAGRNITPKQLGIMEIIHASWITVGMFVYFL